MSRDVLFSRLAFIYLNVAVYLNALLASLNYRDKLRGMTAVQGSFSQSSQPPPQFAYRSRFTSGTDSLQVLILVS